MTSEDQNIPKAETHIPIRKLLEDFRALSHRVMHYANRGLLRLDYLREVSKTLMDFSGCDAVELQLNERDKYYHCVTERHQVLSFHYDIKPLAQDETGAFVPCMDDDSAIARLCRDIVRGHFDPTLPFFTRFGSFWVGDTHRRLSFRLEAGGRWHDYDFSIGDEYRSLAIIPLAVENVKYGILQLRSRKRDFFTEAEIEFYEDAAQTLGVALVHRRAQVALRERIKELTCLYGIAQLVGQHDRTLDEILQSIAELLPPAWLYPDVASARIKLDDRTYATAGYQDGVHKQSADVILKGEKRGNVEVVYSMQKPELDEGPFLKEERSLIDAIAREIAMIVGRRQVEEDKSRLQEQLRHADRLATIGQLAAGVAHELNEPLGNILGFAQLAKKSPELSSAVAQDLEKIEAASLHAREVIKKLMVFARQAPSKKIPVNLNRVIEDGLYLFETRCARAGVELARELVPSLPDITADPSQLNQVLVNLVVNALQAMPEGGKLTVRTKACDNYVALIVEDTGCGMSEEIIKQIFIPFFTTKDIDEGTGLGLPVVHGIVSSHKGTINVESQVGIGSRFEIRLPVAAETGS